MKRLTTNAITKVYEAVVALGLDRNALLAGVDRGVIAGLLVCSSHAGQLLADLHTLNSTPQLNDGSDPLVTWLANASLLASNRPEQNLFRHFMHLATEKAIFEPEQRIPMFSAKDLLIGDDERTYAEDSATRVLDQLLAGSLRNSIDVQVVPMQTGAARIQPQQRRGFLDEEPTETNVSAIFRIVHDLKAPACILYARHDIDNLEYADVFEENTEFTIGRNATNNLVLQGSGVSKQHAKILREKSCYWLYDTSTNGVFRGSRRITDPIVLSHGCRFRIGDYILIFMHASSVKELRPKLYDFIPDLYKRDLITGLYRQPALLAEIEKQATQNSKRGIPTTNSMATFNVDMSIFHARVGEAYVDFLFVALAERLAYFFGASSVISKTGDASLTVWLSDTSLEKCVEIVDRVVTELTANGLRLAGHRVNVTLDVNLTEFRCPPGISSNELHRLHTSKKVGNPTQGED